MQWHTVLIRIISQIITSNFLQLFIKSQSIYLFDFDSLWPRSIIFFLKIVPVYPGFTHFFICVFLHAFPNYSLFKRFLMNQGLFGSKNSCLFLLLFPLIYFIKRLGFPIVFTTDILFKFAINDFFLWNFHDRLIIYIQCSYICMCARYLI